METKKVMLRKDLKLPYCTDNPNSGPNETLEITLMCRYFKKKSGSFPRALIGSSSFRILVLSFLNFFPTNLRLKGKPQVNPASNSIEETKKAVIPVTLGSTRA